MFPYLVIFVNRVSTFVFTREETTRVEEVFHDNGTVSYKNKKYWYFLPSGKCTNWTVSYKHKKVLVLST
jgi:hypothetical protein